MPLVVSAETLFVGFQTSIGIAVLAVSAGSLTDMDYCVHTSILLGRMAGPNQVITYV